MSGVDTERREFDVAEVAAQLRTLGVEAGGVLLVHPSLHAVRPVAGGPEGLIVALREALGPEGTLVMPSKRFALADEWLRRRGLQRAGRAGHADARLARSRDIVRAAVEELAANPLPFLPPRDEGCAECDEARASVRGRVREPDAEVMP